MSLFGFVFCHVYAPDEWLKLPSSLPLIASLPREGRVKRYPVNPGGRLGLPLKSRNRKPDLEQDFLNQFLTIFLGIRVAPSHAAHESEVLSNPGVEQCLSVVLIHDRTSPLPY
jgi:hypothetical protein